MRNRLQIIQLFRFIKITSRYQLTVSDEDFATSGFSTLELAMRRGRIRSMQRGVKFVTLRDTHEQIMLGTFIEGQFHPIEKGNNQS